MGKQIENALDPDKTLYLATKFNLLLTSWNFRGSFGSAARGQSLRAASLAGTLVGHRVLRSEPTVRAELAMAIPKWPRKGRIR